MKPRKVLSTVYRYLTWMSVGLGVAVIGVVLAILAIILIGPLSLVMRRRRRTGIVRRGAAVVTRCRVIDVPVSDRAAPDRRIARLVQ